MTRVGAARGDAKSLAVLPSTDAATEFNRLCFDYLDASDAQRAKVAAALREGHETQGIVMFVQCTPHSDGWGASAWHIYCRSLLCPQVLASYGRIVRHPRNLIIALFDDPADAVRCASLCLMVAHRQSKDFNISIGLEQGLTFDLGDDVYGHAVNIASKLCEDIGGGQAALCVSSTVHDACWTELFGTKRNDAIDTSVSGTSIQYYRIVHADVEAMAMKLRRVACPQRSPLDSPGAAEWAQAFIAGDADLQHVKRGAVMVSDMSGMTRITAARGIVHFLSLIMRMRELCRPRYTAHGGRLLWTEGDDLLVAFETAADAYAACDEMMTAVSEYNKKQRAPHDRIIISAGIATGEYLLCTPADAHGGALERAYALGEKAAEPFEMCFDDAAWREVAAANPSIEAGAEARGEGAEAYHAVTHAAGACKSVKCCALM